MADQLKQFMMGLGFQIDQSGMAKLEAFVKNTENYAKQSAANIDKLVKTLEGYTKGLTRTTAEADKHKQSQEKQAQAAKEFCKQIEECTKGLLKSIEGLGKHSEEQDKNTKSTDGATDSLRRHGEAHHRMREVWKLSKDAAFGFAGAVTALAITGEEMVRRVSKQFESLFYLSQRTGIAGNAIEALRFQFRSVGLDADTADQAIGSMADRIADLPSTLSIISGVVGRTVTNAQEAVTSLAERYNELLRTGSPSDIAQFREFLRLMGQNENVIAQVGRNIGAANTALELHHKILHDLGFGDGAKVAQLLQERSVEFRKSWVGTQEVLGRVAESFAGALMPGLTRFLRAALGGLPDVADGFDELCKSFDTFIKNLVGENGEHLRQWMKDVSDGFKRMATTDNLEKLNSVLSGTAKIIGAIASSIQLIAKYPEIAGALLGAAAGARVAGLPGAIVGGAIGLTTGSTLAGSERDEKWNKQLLDWQRNKSLGTEQRSFQQMQEEFNKQYPKEPPKPEPTGHQRGGIVGINAHVGEAVLPVSLTNMLLRAANQPQSFNAARGQDSLTDIIEQLANDFSQWWSGSASFNPIVQLASDFYDKLSALLHQLLEDFGFEQKAVGGPGGGGAAGEGSGAGEGGGGSPRTGGRFGGMGPGGGGGGGDPGKSPDIAKGNYRNQAIDYFTSQGWTREQAAGIAANLETESAWRKDVVGDHGKAFGLAQWHPDRQAKFKEVYGKDIKESTLGEQLAFVNWELHNTHKNAGDRLRRATTAREAGGVVSQHYEIPADQQGNIARRGALAEQVHTGYSPSGTPMPGAGESAGGPPGPGGAKVTTGGKERGVNPLLVQTMQEGFAATLPEGYSAYLSSGERVGDPGAHGRGSATDWQIRGPRGERVADRGLSDPKAVSMYRKAMTEAIARMYVLNPELAKTAAVGSHFGTEKGGGGPADLMHIDVGFRGPRGRIGDPMSEHREALQRAEELRKAGYGTPAWKEGGTTAPSEYKPPGTPGFGPMLKDFMGTKSPGGLSPMLGEYLRNIGDKTLGTDGGFKRNLGTEKPAWRIERGADANGGDYGGGGDMPRASRADKLEITVTTTGAAHGTGKTSYDMASRESPIRKRNRENNLV